MVSAAAVALAGLAATACTGSAEVVEPSGDVTAASACGPEQAEVRFDPAAKREVLTYVEVSDVAEPGVATEVVLREEPARKLTVEGLPEGQVWTSWLLDRAREHYPDLPFNESHRAPSDSVDMHDLKLDGRQPGRYVQYVGVREADLAFQVSCAALRHEGLIRTWDLSFSGLLECGVRPEKANRPATQAYRHCDRP